jgi:hypothetical protein
MIDEQLFCGLSLSIRITLKNQNCRSEISTDYANLLDLVKKTNENIIRENQEFNELVEEERRELCGIEYAMDHL